MTELVSDSLGLYRFYVASGHSRVDALARLASVLAVSVSASELLAVIEEVEKEIQARTAFRKRKAAKLSHGRCAYEQGRG